MDLWIVPVASRYGGLQVVDDQSLGYAAEMAEGVFQAGHERLRGLSPDGFAVALATVGKDDTEDPRTAEFALRGTDGSAGTKVHLGLFAGFGLHPPKRQRDFPPQPRHEPPHAVVARSLVAMLRPQVLVNPYAFQSLLDLRENLRAEGLAFALRPTGRMTCRARGRVWLAFAYNARRIATNVILGGRAVCIVG